MKKFQATIRGTYITAIFFAIDKKAATVQANCWLATIKSANRLTATIIELN